MNFRNEKQKRKAARKKGQEKKEALPGGRSHSSPGEEAAGGWQTSAKPLAPAEKGFATAMSVFCLCLAFSSVLQASSSQPFTSM